MKKSSRYARLTLALAAAFALASVARSQTYTWIGTTSGNWSSAANWSGGAVPVSGNTANLIFNSYLDLGYTATNDIASPFVAQSITVNNTSSGNSPFGVLLTGPIQMNGTNASLNNNGPGDLYIGPLSGTASTWDLEAPTTITGTNAGQLRITDQITGSGSLTINRPTTNLANGFTLLFYMNSSAANTITGGVTLQAGNLSIGGQSGTSSTPSNLGTGTFTIATTGTGLAATGDVRANSGQPVIVTVPVTINNGATLEQFRGTQIVLGTPVTGLGGVSVGTAIWASSATTSALAFEGASTYSGSTDLTNSTVIVRGTNGALTGTSQITLYRNSTLTLDSNGINAGTGNTAGNQTSQDRISDSTPLIFHQGALNMIANTVASTTETVGTLTGDGWNTFNLSPQTATGVTLTVSNLVRSNHGTFEFRGVNLGANSAGTANSADVVLSQLNGLAPTAALVGGGGADGSTNISIIPYMTGGSTAGSAGNTFVTYDTNGLRVLNTATEFATSLAPGSTNNVRTTVPLVVAGQPSTANSLIVGAASAGLFGFGGTSGQVTVTSGAVLTTSATSYLNVGTLNFGGAEAVITGNGTTNINSAITNNAGLTYSGSARAGLLSPNSVISGPISTNSGTLAINNQAQLGGTPSINFNGGTLSVSNLGTGTADVLSTPINVGPAGGILNVVPVGGTVSSTSQAVTLTGAITGTGPLIINATGGLSNGFLVAGGGGTVVLAGDASGYSGMVTLNGGVLQFDSDARLGSNAFLALSSDASLSQPATLHVTATTATNKNLIVGGFGAIQVDAGATYTVNGYVSAMGAISLRKFGAGNLVLTGQNTYSGQVFVGSAAMTGNINVTSGAAGTFSGIGGTLTLSGQGALLDTISTTIAPGGKLVLDNTGTNLSNRLSAYAVNMAGGSLVLMGNSSAASSEITGPMTLAANSGSFVQVVPGAGQTAALYFSGATTGGFVRANTTGNGSTVTFNAPELGGTTAGAGQINFIPDSPSATLPTLVGGGGSAGTSQISIFPFAFGEDPTASAIGLVTGIVVPANPTTGFPSYYGTRLLNPTTEYVNGSPDSGSATANYRLTTATNSSASPTANALFLDTGGSLTIASGNAVTLTSGTLVMAGGTSITGGVLAAGIDADLAIYVGTGTATLGSDVATSSSALPAVAHTLAKTGPGTLVLTTVIGATAGSAPATIAIQRGTLRLGTGGGLPTTANVSVDAGATFDLNSPGATVTINRLVGLGSVLLGSNAATDLQVTVPSTAPSTAVFGGTITGSGTIEKLGPGTLEFGPTASYTGPIALTAGTLQFGDPSGFATIVPTVAGSAITAADGTTIAYSAIQNLSRPININVGTTSGTVNLTGNQNSTTQLSGLITLASGKTLNITTSAGGLYNFAGAIIGVGNVTWNAGLDIISGTNTYVGSTSIANASATIGIGSDSAFGSGTVTVSAAASFFAAGPNHTVPNAVNLTAAGITFGTVNPVYQGYNLTFAGPVTLNSNTTITTIGAGVITLSNVGGSVNLIKAGGGTLALGGSSTYSGTTADNVGTLLINGTVAAGGGAVSVASGAFLGGSGTFSRDVSLVAGATVEVNGNNFTIGSLTGTGGTVVNNATTAGTLTVGTDNTSTAFGGTIADGWTGPLALAKVGTGILTLTGTNTYSGGTTISGGTLSIANDASLGAGPVAVSAFGTLNYTTTTSTTRSFPLASGTVSVSAGQTLTLNGSQVSGGYLAGPGVFATNPTTGAQIANTTIRASAIVNSNSSSDLFLNVNNGGTLTVAAGLTSPVTMAGFTNQGSGTVTVGAASVVNVSDFQSYGMLTLTPAVVGSGLSTELFNAGTSPMYFNGGSEAFIGTAATVGPQNNPNFVAGVDLHGSNAVVQGGLFVNNGFVVDSTNAGTGTATIIADFGALVKGAGFFQNTVITQNGGKYQAGNSPGSAAFGSLVLGPGGVGNYIFAIDDATGTAGPRPDAFGHVSGWSLMKAVQQAVGPATTLGNFTWTASAADPLMIALDTLVNPTTVGTDVSGPMADFDPSKSYVWPAVQWTGTYAGPTDAATLNADTAFDTSGFVNPINGTFGWSFDGADNTLSLTYSPTPVPEPGTLTLVALAAVGFAANRRRRAAGRQISS